MRKKRKNRIKSKEISKIMRNLEMMKTRNRKRKRRRRTKGNKRSK
jgi:hypothetical protein